MRQEARYRLKQGKGIKVFSRPEALASYLEENDLSIAEREDCIVDAGQLVPGGSLMGMIDFERRRIDVVGALPPPTDSVGTPSSFTRGVSRLRADIEAAPPGLVISCGTSASGTPIPGAGPPPRVEPISSRSNS